MINKYVIRFWIISSKLFKEIDSRDTSTYYQMGKAMAQKGYIIGKEGFK